MNSQVLPCSLLAAAISAITIAWALSGQVTDAAGKAIANAHIEVVGGSEHTQSNAKGEFKLPLDSVDELHVKAPGYSHKILHLHGEHGDNLQIQLNKTILEVVDVIGLPIHASKIESAQPVTVLAGQELLKKQTGTLGETLKNEVGVHSTYYGGVAASPVIRSLDGPRVLITQNGLDTGDVSRIGPDHAVTASTAQQIEILRGPAILWRAPLVVWSMWSMTACRKTAPLRPRSPQNTTQLTVNPYWRPD